MPIKHSKSVVTKLLLVLSLSLCPIPGSAEWLVVQNGIYSTRMGNYCPFEQNLFIQAKDPIVYGKDQSELNEIIKTSIIKMQNKCKNMKRVFINGALNGKWHYWGTASKKNNWGIKGEIVKDAKGYIEPYMFPLKPKDIYLRGLMFLRGGRLAKDERMGFLDISEAARGNYPEAQYLLGRFNEEGFVDRKNKYNAVALYKKAAAQGNQKAKERLDQLSSKSKQQELEKIKRIKQWNRKGLVYKSDRFWQDLIDFDAARRIFEGDFSRVKSDVQFKRYFVDFINTYSNRCKSYLPPESVKHTYIVDEVTTNAYGFESRSELSRTVTYVDKRYYPYYLEYIEDINDYDRRHPAEVFSLVVETVNNGVFSALDKMNFFRMAQFFDKAKTCKSATVNQMKDNFLRAAKGMPPLQNTDVILANAENESDSIEKSVRQKTFVQACLDYHGELNPKGSYERWCTCLNSGLSGGATSSELSKYADNMRSFYEKISTITESTNVAPNDRGWQIVNVSNKCKKS